MSEQEARQAQFSRTAAHIINSPYFSDPERLLQEMEGNEDKAVEEFHRREQEYYVLIEAIRQAQTEDDLSPEAKKVFDHVQQQIENDAVWQERIYGETEFSAKMEPEASRLMGPDSEDSALLAQAIAEAHQQGDTETAEKLSELSRTPWKIRQALGHDGAIETFPEEQSTRREDIKPKVKPSPLRREKSYSSYRSKAMVEKTDKRGRRYCIEEGRGRVPCPDRGGSSGTQAKTPSQGAGGSQAKAPSKLDNVNDVIDKARQEGLTTGKVALIANDLADMKLADLQALAIKMGRRKTGKKAELADRIKEALTAEIIPPKPAPPVQVAPAPTPTPVQTTAKPAPKPVPVSTPKPVPAPVSREFPQRDANHPVAKSISEDQQIRKLIDDLLEGAPPEIHELTSKITKAQAEMDQLIQDRMKPGGDDNEVVSNFYKKHGELSDLEKKKDKITKDFREKLLAALKPTNPPVLDIEHHQGESALKRAVRGAIKGALILGGPLNFVVGIGAGNIVGAIIGGVVGIIRKNIKPFTATEEQNKAVNEGSDFIRGICNWVGKAGNKVIVGESSTGRAFYTSIGSQGSKGPTVMIGIHNRPSSMVHELGHMIEEQKQGIKDKVVDFFKYRTEGHPIVDMGDLPGGGKMKGEKGCPDDFGRVTDPLSAAYIGKTYKGLTGKVHNTEILSMGVEALYSDPINFMAKDPEYAAFVIQCLRA